MREITVDAASLLLLDRVRIAGDGIGDSTHASTTTIVGGAANGSEPRAGVARSSVDDSASAGAVAFAQAQPMSKRGTTGVGGLFRAEKKRNVKF